MSLTITGVVTLILGLVLTPEETDTFLKFIDLGVTCFGILATYWGRYRIGDITWYGARK